MALVCLGQVGQNHKTIGIQESLTPMYLFQWDRLLHSTISVRGHVGARRRLEILPGRNQLWYVITQKKTSMAVIPVFSRTIHDVRSDYDSVQPLAAVEGSAQPLVRILGSLRELSLMHVCMKQVLPCGSLITFCKVP